MTDLTIVPEWNESINRIEKNEYATGGADGNINLAPRQLAENVFWLKSDIDGKITTLTEYNTTQDAAISAKANTLDVDTKNALQDTLISKNKSDIATLAQKNIDQDSGISTNAANIVNLVTENTNQDAAINLKASISDVNAKNVLQDAAISANATSIIAITQKNTEQDTAINLRAEIADVDAKNATQDAAIATATGNITALTATVGTHSTDINNLKTTVLQPRTISATGDATWSVTFDGTSNVSAAMTVRSATTAVKGIVQLNNTVSSTSTTLAATANSVKIANDKATAAIPKADKGVANGVAALNASGVIPDEQLPPLPSADALNKIRILALAGL